MKTFANFSVTVAILSQEAEAEFFFQYCGTPGEQNKLVTVFKVQ